MTEIRDCLIKASNDGNFLEVVCQSYLDHSDDRMSVGQLLASLHNEGKIDVISEFKKLRNDSETPSFFSTRHAFIDALPMLNASVYAVMNCVKHLVAEAGSDMSATWPFGPFIKFCEADAKRPKEVLKIAESSNSEWLDFISPAIISGSNIQLSEYVIRAIELSGHENFEIKSRAVIAIGRINYCDDISLSTNALLAVEKVIQSEYDDRLFSVALKSAFYLYLVNNELECKVVDLMQTALFQRGDYVLHAASELFMFEKDQISPVFLDVLLEALKDTKPHNKGTLDNIDYGLQHLLKTNQEDKAISFLEYLLVHNSNELSIQIFDSLIHELYDKNSSILNKLATRWFLSKKIPLCSAIMDIVGMSHGNDIVLLADVEQFTNQPERSRLFASRKAIGWLYMNPVSATSFVVSLLDTCSDKEIELIARLLFYPLLISYRDSIKTYLDNIFPSQSPKAQGILTNALAQLENYYEGLKSTQDIPELLPSQSQRETHFRRSNRQMEDAYKSAQKSSIMNLIASTSVLLYGRKSIHYIHGLNDQKYRQEIPLQSFSHSIAFPKLGYMDPHGLDYMLRIFRVEGGEK